MQKLTPTKKVTLTPEHTLHYSTVIIKLMNGKVVDQKNMWHEQSIPRNLHFWYAMRKLPLKQFAASRGQGSSCILSYQPLMVWGGKVQRINGFVNKAHMAEAFPVASSTSIAGEWWHTVVLPWTPSHLLWVKACKAAIAGQVLHPHSKFVPSIWRERERPPTKHPKHVFASGHCLITKSCRIYVTDIMICF